MEEDGSPVRKWSVDDILVITPSGTVDDSVSSCDVSLSPDNDNARSPLFMLPHSLTEEEDCLLEESFGLMEDLMSKKDVYQLKDDFEENEGSVAEKAQALLDHLDEYIKKGMFLFLFLFMLFLINFLFTT